MVVDKQILLQTKSPHSLAWHEHLVRHFHKHAHKILHVYRHLHHAFLHMGELMIIACISLSGVLFANFSGSLVSIERHSPAEVASSLLQAINNPQSILTNGNLISVRTTDESVYNSFYTGFCTYGAALISPEFFPFTDSKTQQRTRGGNAVNRCENAQATGFKIGNTPAQGALVVYDAGGRFGAYGHVGKVMHYDRTLDKIIVRDMARVAPDVMSDHREIADNPEIKCFIYSKGNVSQTTTVAVATPPQVNTGTILIHTGATNTQNTSTTTTVPTHGVATTTGTTSSPSSSTSTQTTPVATPITPTIPTTTTTTTTPTNPTPTPTPVITTPVIPPVIAPLPVIIPSIPEISLNFDNISNLGQHLAGIRDIKAELDGATTLAVGDQRVLTISITDKKTGENISQVLPLAFNFIVSQSTISLDYSTVNLVNDGKIEIHVSALQKGTSTLIINFGDDEIGKIGFTIE